MRPLLLGAVLLAGCAAPSPSPSASGHAAHDPQLDRVKAGLTAAFGMTFEPAGPHHEIGRTPDLIELDLVGVPVEQIVLSVPGNQPTQGIAYLPHLRELLPGPGPVWAWVEDGLTCRGRDAVCESMIARGNLTASFTDGDPSYVVLVIARR